MCEFLDRIEARGKARGEAIGEARGEEKKAKEMAKILHEKNVSIDIIAASAGVTVSVVKEWLGLVSA